jgi:shikimate kinase
MKHLVLVGLMGAGKTTIGRRCAHKLDRPFIDTDDLAVTLAGRPFTELWAEGELTFRAWERRAVDDAVRAPVAHVIACGGGAILDPHNRQVLRDHGVVVWLRARTDTLVERVGDGSGRPLLASTPRAALARLERLRGPAYEGAAHTIVDVDDMTIDHATDAVIAAFERLDVTP